MPKRSENIASIAAVAAVDFKRVFRFIGAKSFLYLVPIDLAVDFPGSPFAAQ